MNDGVLPYDSFHWLRSLDEEKFGLTHGARGDLTAWWQELRASPDGLVGKDGLIEIKCPKTTTHTTTLISQKVPSHYMNQMMWQMACTGRDWCDFVSYSPFFPDNLKMFVRRVQRDEEHIKQLEDEVTKFLTEVEDTIKFLQGVK